MDLLGYSKYDKDTVMLESVTLEEYDKIIGFLDEIRNKKEEDENE